MTSTAEKYANLVEALYFKTVQRNQSWSLTSSPNRYLTNLGQYIIQIWEDGDYTDGQVDVTLSIYNETGDIVDTFSDITLSALAPSVEGFDNYYALMRELYRRASREATGAEKVLDDILLHLGVDPAKATSRKKKNDDEIPF